MRYGFIRSRLIVLMIILITVLSACGQSSLPNRAEPGPGTPENEKRKMSMYDWLREGRTITNIHNEVVDEFNNRPDVNASFTVRHIPGIPYYTKLNAGLAANDGPDVFTSHAAGVLEMYANAERLLSLNEALRADPEWKASFKPGVFDQLTFNDNIYAIPTSFAAVALFYNKQIFEQYSLSPPRTYEDLKQVIRVLANNRVTPFAFGAKTPWTAAQFSELVTNRLGGNEPFDAIMDGSGSWMHPSFIESGHIMQELRDMRAFPADFLDLDNEAVNRMFEQGKAAMLVTGSWVINDLLAAEDSTVKDVIGVVRFPSFEQGIGDTDTWLGQPAVNIAVSAEANDTSAAIELLKMFTSEKYQRRIAEESGDIPVIRLDLAEDRSPMLSKELQMEMSTMKRMFLFYDVSLGTIIGDEYNNTIQAILAGKNPEEAFLSMETFTQLHRGN